MPLKPALSTIHPKTPQPREVRKVACPQCGQSFEISMKAMSVRCPGCTRPLEFKDLTIRQRLEGDIATMGHVGLDTDGEMVGRLVCGQLTNEGRLEGKTIVYGSVHLMGNSLTTGELTGRSLFVARGATLRVRAQIGPKQKVSQNARMLSYRPLRRVSRRSLTGVGATPSPLLSPRVA
jgi:DNA-directed RNA polymerase subunit RPC12/RpoP